MKPSEHIKIVTSDAVPPDTVVLVDPAKEPPFIVWCKNIGQGGKK